MALNPPTSWDVLLQGDGPAAVSAIEQLLDGLSASDRVSFVRRARSEHLQGLFELCRERPLTRGHLVPAGATECVHDGVNSLPLFRIFQKRLFRGKDGELAGYNPGPFNWAITPGYFRVREEQSHLFFDYTELPEDVPEGWPRPIPNADKLGRFVYHGLRDDMRRVSRDVCIGAVARHGQPIGTWFALCRR